MKELFSSYEFWGSLAAIATGVIGFFSGKRKSAAETDSIEVINSREILTTYKTELEYFSKQLDTTRAEIKQLRLELSTLLDTACYNKNCKSRKQ